jgi:hypothetical protein
LKPVQIWQWYFSVSMISGLDQDRVPTWTDSLERPWRRPPHCGVLASG